MKAKKPKLHVFTLEQYKGRREVYVLKVGDCIVRYFLNKKAISVEDAANAVETLAHSFDQPSEFKIRRRDGTYSPARTYPRSADPRKSKG